ncbi:MAG: PaaI family thioesterase [Nevskiales bacterium]|nr:PaaI family thioesterase [Nevskiales bacterium]
MSEAADPMSSSTLDRDVHADTQATWQSLLERIPYARHLGLEVQHSGTRVQVHLPYRDALIGNIMLPAVHGGAIGGLIEITARIAAQSRDARARRPRILDCNVDYLRSARARSTYAAAEIVRQGRRTTLVHVSCWQDRASTPVAHGRVQLLFETVPNGKTREQQ